MFLTKNSLKGYCRCLPLKISYLTCLLYKLIVSLGDKVNVSVHLTKEQKFGDHVLYSATTFQDYSARSSFLLQNCILYDLCPSNVWGMYKFAKEKKFGVIWLHSATTLQDILLAEGAASQPKLVKSYFTFSGDGKTRT